MNSRLLSIFLLFCSIAFGQIPTSGLQRAYDFTNGSLAEAANGENFTQKGAELTTINDKFTTANNRISLNGDSLSSSNFDFTDLSI